MTTTPLQANDCRRLPYTPEVIWPVLSDIKRYPEWWPKMLFARVTPAESGLIGTELHLRPMGLQPLTCKITALETEHSIDLEYIGHFITGHAQWLLEPQDQLTTVRYVVDVQIHGPLVALVSKLINLQPFHSYSMRNILAELEKQVQQHATLQS